MSISRDLISSICFRSENCDRDRPMVGGIVPVDSQGKFALKILLNGCVCSWEAVPDGGAGRAYPPPNSLEVLGGDEGRVLLPKSPKSPEGDEERVVASLRLACAALSSSLSLLLSISRLLCCWTILT